MIYFEVNGQGYAIDSAELAGVATSCPYVSYPGLPRNVLGLVLWSGKVFPVIDAFKSLKLSLGAATFLFSNATAFDGSSEIAIPVAGPVQVFLAQESTGSASVPDNPMVIAVLKDSEGKEALQISTLKAAELLAASVEAYKNAA